MDEERKIKRNSTKIIEFKKDKTGKREYYRAKKLAEYVKNNTPKKKRRRTSETLGTQHLYVDNTSNCKRRRTMGCPD